MTSVSTSQPTGTRTTTGAYSGSCSISTPAYAPTPDWLDLDGTADDTKPSNDFGDLPTAAQSGFVGSYPTTRADNGPRHIVAGTNPYMGSAPDAESDGQPGALADGDDTLGLDDEDGVAGPLVLLPPTGTSAIALSRTVQAYIQITVTNPAAVDATLYGWLDLDGSGTFDAGEHASVVVPANTTTTTATLPFGIAPQTTPDITYARFRLSTDPAAASPTGLVGDGEVEDWLVAISNPDPTFASLDALGAHTDTNGDVVVEWTTRREVGTLGFHLERWDEGLEDWLRVTDEAVPSPKMLGAPQGGTYGYVDAGAYRGEAYRYPLVEEEVWGSERVHGPFEVTVDGAGTRGVHRADRWRTRKGRLAGIADGPVEMAHGKRFRALAHRLDRRNRRQAGGGAVGLDALSAQIDAAGPGPARLEVRADGLYEVSAASIAEALGERQILVRSWIRRGALALGSQGQAVAWEAIGRGDGLRFYGHAPAENPYTDVAVYWLEPGSRSGLETEHAGVEAAAEGQTYTATRRYEEDNVAASAAATDPEGDYWRWAVMKGGNEQWGSVATDIELHDLVTDAEASLRLDLQFVRDVGHEVVVAINGTSLPESVAVEGSGEHSATLGVPAGLLVSGTNQVAIETRTGIGATATSTSTASPSTTSARPSPAAATSRSRPSTAAPSASTASAAPTSPSTGSGRSPRGSSTC